jgi:hypothetical protein
MYRCAGYSLALYLCPAINPICDGPYGAVFIWRCNSFNVLRRIVRRGDKSPDFQLIRTGSDPKNNKTQEGDPHC